MVATQRLGQAPRQRGRPVVSRADAKNNNRVADTREERPEQRHALRDRRRARGRVELLVRRRAQHHDVSNNPEQVVRRVYDGIIQSVALASKDECCACGHEAEMSCGGGDG